MQRRLSIINIGTATCCARFPGCPNIYFLLRFYFFLTIYRPIYYIFILNTLSYAVKNYAVKNISVE